MIQKVTQNTVNYSPCKIKKCFVYYHFITSYVYSVPHFDTLRFTMCKLLPLPIYCTIHKIYTQKNYV